MWERLSPSNFHASHPSSDDPLTTRQRGQQQEDLASRYLRQSGYRIEQRNFRTKVAELDIVARDGDTLVLVEVRYRRGNVAMAQYTVDQNKQRKLWRAAQHYLRRYPWEGDIRFDVIAINGAQVEHYRDAFRGEDLF
ncbi:YraN family protein [Desulfurispira natronophila]|uniref:YraN family protein n=1 Tax=Desulfurispira natronophila TaxID=682562 RepID=UPI001C84C3F2